MWKFVAVVLLLCSGISFADPFIYVGLSGTVETSGSCSLLTIDAANDSKNYYDYPCEPDKLVVNSSGKQVYMLYSGYNPHGLSVFDTDKKTIVANLLQGDSTVMDMALSSDGTRLYVMSQIYNGTIYVIDAINNVLLKTIHPWQPIFSTGLLRSLAINPAGTELYVTIGGDSYDSIIPVASVIDVTVGSEVARIPLSAEPGDLAFNPAGTRAYITLRYTNNPNGSKITVIDTALRKQTASVALPVGYDPLNIAINQAGTRAYVVSSNNSSSSITGSLNVLDLSTNTVMSLSNNSLFYPTRVALDSMGTRAYVGDFASNAIVVFDTASLNEVYRIQHGGQFNDMAVAPSSASPPPNTSQITCLFDWAQSNYPSLLSPASTGLSTLQNYIYRYYSKTQFYLAVSFADSHVYYMSVAEGIIHDLGPFSVWKVTSNCAGSGYTAQPTVSLAASPTTVNSGSSSTLQWSSTNATSCTASGGWNGNKATSGSLSTGALASNQTYNLSCSGGGGTASQSVTVTVNNTPAPAISLLSSKTVSITGSGTVTTGTLTWTVTNATTCTASGGWNGSVATSGTWSTGALTSSTTYTLTCSGNGGSTSASNTIVVDTPPSPTLTFTASPNTVNFGGASTLQWSATNATSCTASGGWLGTIGTSGSSSTGGLTTDTTFNLSCSGSGGSVNKSITVTVNKAQSLTVSLTSTQSVLHLGQSATLQWSSTNATSCSLSDSSGITYPSTAISGSMLLNYTNPSFVGTSTYTLTCYGPGYTPVSKSVSIGFN